jgi:hypothetical protein
MVAQMLRQELGIAYYKTMSKFVQYRRSVLKNNISSLQAKIFQNPLFSWRAIQ